MTEWQMETIELMKRLGSKGHVVNANGVVRVSVPFSEDRNPNITVWANGSWHDFSNPPHTKQWQELGLNGGHGYLDDLRRAVKNYFPRMWEQLPYPAKGDSYSAYIQKRGLAGDIRIHQNSLAFPIVDSHEIVIGIQTRRIDGQEPKNLMVHGSNGKDGLFVSQNDYQGCPVIICEGATDTYTWVSGYTKVGAVSSTMLEGVKEWIRYYKDSHPYLVLALDEDDAGRDAQAKILEFMLGIGISRERIKVLVHHGKDLNDEVTGNYALEFRDLDAVQQNLFVKVVDEISPEMESALWVGFFPPDFPSYKHSFVPDGQHSLYVFPGSYPRTQVNQKMYNLKSSAYILRGW